jgi:hypothetical protein
MHRILPTLLLLAACNDMDTLRIALLTQESTREVVEGSKHEAVVREAVAILGYDVRFVEPRRGSVVLELADIPSGPITGRALVMRGCFRAAWAVPRTHIIAHEVAHALGLEHVDADGNLMQRTAHPDNTDLEPFQQAELDRNVLQLWRC